MISRLIAVSLGAGEIILIAACCLIVVGVIVAAIIRRVQGKTSCGGDCGCCDACKHCKSNDISDAK